MKKLLVLIFIFGLVSKFGIAPSYVPYVKASEVFHVDDDYPDSEDADGDNKFRHIQAVIDAATNGDIIIIHPGTFYESINFLGKSITVKSTDPNNLDVVAATIIDSNQKASVVTFNSGEGSDSLLCGVTIQGGEAAKGGGIYYSSSSPSIINCTITGNKANSGSAYVWGGGVYCYKSASMITDCRIIKNSARGEGGYSFSNNPNPFSGLGYFTGGPGYGRGGGIYCQESNLVITNCKISKNSATGSGSFSPSMNGKDGNGFGGGIYCSLSSIDIINCIITDNSAIGSGRSSWYYYDDGFTTVFDQGDGYAYGGGIYCDGTALVIINCTFNGNSAKASGENTFVYGGGIGCYHNSSPTITNCIYWENTPNEIYEENSTLTMNFSDIQGGYTGEGMGNINADPLFINPEDGDYRLKTHSPCIDAGTSDGAPDRYKNGTFRPIGEGHDMGAYEGAYEYGTIDTEKKKKRSASFTGWPFSQFMIPLFQQPAASAWMPTLWTTPSFSPIYQQSPWQTGYLPSLSQNQPLMQNIFTGNQFWDFTLYQLTF